MENENDKVENDGIQAEKDFEKNYFTAFENVSEIADYFSSTGEVSSCFNDEDCFKPFSDVNDIISYFKSVEDNNKERRGR